MRSIGTGQTLEQKRKRNSLYISIFMLAVLVFGTVGYAFLTYQNDSTNNQQNLQQEGGGILFEGKNYYFSNTPEQVKDIEVSLNISLNDYVEKEVYVATNNSAVVNEAIIFLSSYASKIQEACYGKCTEDLPEKTCAEKLIVWKDSEKNRVYQNGGCVFIEGDSKAVDAFVYKLMGKI